MLKVRLRRRLGESIYRDVHSAVSVWQKLLRTLVILAKRHRLNRVEASHLLLHLGCGADTKDGWINLDIDPPPGGYAADFRDPIPLSDGCAQHIHCEHVLEHLEYEEALSFLRECHRLLETGGSLRLILPDAEKYLRAYCDDDMVFFAMLRHLGGAVRPLERPIEVINQMFRMGGAHRFAWDFQTLKYHLERIGFASIERSCYGNVAAEYRIDGSDSWRKHESIYLNVYKAGRTVARLGVSAHSQSPIE